MPAGRPKGIWTPDLVRSRIQTTKLMQRLENHALGLTDMTPTQIQAANIVLRKAVPDLASIEHSGDVNHHHSSEMSEAELERIATGGSARTAKAPSKSQTVN